VNDGDAYPLDWRARSKLRRRLRRSLIGRATGRLADLALNARQRALGVGRELDALAEHWRPLAERSTRHAVTLLYGARDEEHNNAVALKAYLDSWLHTHGPR